MKPMTFEEIWSRFDWILNDMREGMCFLEAYIPAIGKASKCDFIASLQYLSERTKGYGLEYSTWSNDSSESDWNRKYTLSEYVNFFYTEKIFLLHFDYICQASGIEFVEKLIFEREDEIVNLEIIVYREAILEAADPKEAVRLAILELRKLHELFGGNSLFLGPDTLNYPVTESDYPKEWLRIE